MKTPKYRPVLTSDQISHIINLCKSDLSNDSISVISILAPFKAKIENLGLLPAYTTEGQTTISDRLGFSTNQPKSRIEIRDEKWKKAYEKWVINKASCSLEELEYVQDYRMLNNLMSPEELQEIQEKLHESIQKNMEARNNNGSSSGIF